MSSNRNLVVGAFSGYSVTDLMPFVESLKQTDFDGEICFLYANCSVETVLTLEKHGIEMVPFKHGGTPKWNPKSSNWRYLKHVTPFLPDWAAKLVLKRITKMATARFLFLRDYLDSRRDELSHVFFCDLRDVIFQSNPFVGELPRPIFRAYEEDPGKLLGNDTKYNANWTESLLGKEVLESIGKHPILCCGTILADVDSMIRYLDNYFKVLMRGRSLMLTEDQVVLNYLARLHPDRIPGLQISPNGEHEVLTLGWVETQSLRWDEGFETILNSLGDAVPVVHQYDRDQTVSNRLLSRLQ